MWVQVRKHGGAPAQLRVGGRQDDLKEVWEPGGEVLRGRWAGRVMPTPIKPIPCSLQLSSSRQQFEQNLMWPVSQEISTQISSGPQGSRQGWRGRTMSHYCKQPAADIECTQRTHLELEEGKPQKRCNGNNVITQVKLSPGSLSQSLLYYEVCTDSDVLSLCKGANGLQGPSDIMHWLP